MDSRGQAGDVFKLLVEVIMGAMILAIILGAVDYFSNLRVDVSERRLADAFSNAYEKTIATIQADEQTVIVAKDLLLYETTYGTRAFTHGYGIDDDCMHFETSGSSAFELEPEDQGQVIRITQTVQTDVYMQCFTPEASPVPAPISCSSYCIVSFGKKLPVTS